MLYQKNLYYLNQHKKTPVYNNRKINKRRSGIEPLFIRRLRRLSQIEY